MSRNRNFFIHLILLCIFIVWVSEKSWANVLILPESMISEALSESVPTAFPLEDIHEDDYQVTWLGSSIPEVVASIEKGSLQWVRVQSLFVIPRAKLRIQGNHLQSGRVSNLGFSQGFIANGSQDGSLEIPVALMSAQRNGVDIEIKRNGKILRGKLKLSFKPRKATYLSQGRVFIDPSCSPFGVSVESLGDLSADWAYIGCRQTVTMSNERQTSSLELYIYWDNVGDSIEVGGIPTLQSSVSVWPLRLRTGVTDVSVRGNQHEMKIHYQLPSEFHKFSFSLGVGAYSVGFQGSTSQTTHIAPLPTLYGSYFIAEDLRIVGFGGVALDSSSFTDLGLYLRFEQFRFYDRRISINLLVGGHGIGFKDQGQFNLVPSFPQGFELIFTDAFQRGRNLVFGVFISPDISGVSYYEGWLRWGGKFFGELNYISSSIQQNSIPYNFSIVGVSFGFPVARFW